MVHSGRQILGDVRATQASTRAIVRLTEPLLLQSAASLASTGNADIDLFQVFVSRSVEM